MSLNRPAASLGRFFAAALGWVLVLTALWMQVSAWTSYPAGRLAEAVLNYGATDWIRAARTEAGHLEAETRIEVPMQELPRGAGRAELVAEVDIAHYAYGLPLFLALLAASRSRHLVRNALAGYVVLLIPQAFSLVFEILKQILVVAGTAASLHIAQWQMEVIALGYQCGSLLLPTLAPVGVWLWLERMFLAAVIVDGLLRTATKRTNPG